MFKWLRKKTDQRIDAALATAYDLLPPSDAEKDWAEISVEGLGLANLDW